MQKVEMVIAGRKALVDADMVKLMTRKMALVEGAVKLQSVMDAVPREAYPVVAGHLDDIMKKIQSLNKRIRKTVVFL